MEQINPQTLVILGPTAGGKTELALSLAKRLDGEIISADSRQIYKHLAAGTAKPAGRWSGENYLVEGIPYHLADFLDPRERYSAGQFAGRASAVISQIQASGKRPIVAGGTGLYLKALFEGMDNLPGADPEIRQRLKAEIEACGPQELHRRLKEIDPEAARRIPPQNVQRLIRALEVHEITGKPISNFWTRTGPLSAVSRSPLANPRSPVPNPLFIGLWWEKEQLKKRIEKRAREIFPKMLQETRALIGRGCPQDAPGLQSLGYPEALQVLSGQMTSAQGLEKLIQKTCAYAKRQRTWFRHQHPSTRWLHLEGEENPEILAETVAKDLEAAVKV